MANPQKAGQRKETVLTRFLLFWSGGIDSFVGITRMPSSLIQNGSQSLDWPARLSCLRSISTLIFGKNASFMISWRLSCCQRVLETRMEEVLSKFILAGIFSSPEFDSGVDDLASPKKYIVWSTHMNTHVLPEFLVCIKTPFNFNRSPRRLRSPWMPFPLLIKALSKFLPPSQIFIIQKHYRVQQWIPELKLRAWCPHHPCWIKACHTSGVATALAKEEEEQRAEGKLHPMMNNDDWKALSGFLSPTLRLRFSQKPPRGSISHQTEAKKKRGFPNYTFLTWRLVVLRTWW
ncbi:BnaC08g21790D [Brassica napus]|uniref:BnaC08g21790D protein n=1 Tax=Brassica napus TaxID=3708 RepID=A0A078FXK8_BRANA|nr:BnaC08g21790D [Brassica napus]